MCEDEKKDRGWMYQGMGCMIYLLLGVALGGALAALDWWLKR